MTIYVEFQENDNGIFSNNRVSVLSTHIPYDQRVRQMKIYKLDNILILVSYKQCRVRVSVPTSTRARTRLKSQPLYYL